MAILDQICLIIAGDCVGEICIRSENVTSEYSSNAAANNSAFSGSWFHKMENVML